MNEAPLHNDAHIRIICEAIFSDGVLLSLAQKHENKPGIKSICFDMQYVEFLHSPSLAELVRTYTHLQKRGITLKVVHLAPINAQIMKRTNLDQLIEVIV